MTNAIALGSYVFFGTRKGVVIEKKGGKVAICWLGRVQTIAENIPTWALTLNSTNIRRKVGQTRRDAIKAYLLAARTAADVSDAISTDRGVVLAGVMVLVAVVAVLWAFMAGIAIPFRV